MTLPTPQTRTVAQILTEIQLKYIEGAIAITRSGSQERGQASFNLRVAIRHTCSPQDCLNDLIRCMDKLLSGASDLKTDVYTGYLIWVWSQDPFISASEEIFTVVQMQNSPSTLPYLVRTGRIFESTCHIGFEQAFVRNPVGKFSTDI